MTQDAGYKDTAMLRDLLHLHIRTSAHLHICTSAKYDLNLPPFMLLGLQNVTFEFGARTIVEDATWHIQPNERIGLIGYNGTGKSTLLKVFTGEYQPAKGTVEKSRDTTIGF